MSAVIHAMLTVTSAPVCGLVGGCGEIFESEESDKRIS